MEPLFILWLAAFVAFIFAYRAGRRREKNSNSHKHY